MEYTGIDLGMTGGTWVYGFEQHGDLHSALIRLTFSGARKGIFMESNRLFGPE